MISYQEIARETSRLIVRPLRNSDYLSWLRGYDNQKESQSSYDEGHFDTSFMTYDWYLEKLAERMDMARADKCYMFNIFLLEDNSSLGNCDITTHMRDDFQYARVGYTIHNQFWGHGYATDALKALLHIGFKAIDFHRLEAHINLDNPASKKVAEKAGMQFECIRKGFIFENGNWTDNEVYYINNPF